MSSQPVQGAGDATPVDSDRFRRACARFATGITVVTTLDPDGNPHGMTANSFTSVSLDPPLVLVCVDFRAKILHTLRNAERLGINVLSEHQQDLSSTFARSGADRFSGVQWHAGASGVPLLPGALAWLECVLVNNVEAGDHAILIARVNHAECHDGRPLLYFSSGYHHLHKE
jgi:flavin reductase (DIM6/NTAB) family NADH-FMN oxidoreductase RutF